MPALTPAAVLRYKAQAKRREIRDTLAPGLHLVIQPAPSGSKSWALRFRRPGGRPAKLTLGRVELSREETSDTPVIGGALTLRQARELANKVDRDRARGLDVIEEAKATKQRQRAELEDRAENTFGAAALEFFIDYKTKKWGTLPRQWKNTARVLGLQWPRHCDPRAAAPTVIRGSLADIWAGKPLASIDGHDIHTVVDEARRHGIRGLPRHTEGVSEARGRKMHAALSVLFRWAVRQRRVVANPCVGVWRPEPPAPRERVLTDAEIVRFWRVTDALPVPFGAALKLLLLTGCRRSEVAGMRVSELGADGIWTLPGARTKNHLAHVVPLPPLAQRILEDVPRVAGGFVFTTTGTAPIAGWSKIKRAVDAAMGPGVPAWRLHDLRRTAVTGMAELGVAPHIVEACVNHVSGAKSGIAGVYNKAVYAPEKKAALERWAAHVETLVTGKPTNNVVNLPVRERV